jgi:hypothetical protein
LLTFGRFVGSWDVQVTDYRDDGTEETASGEWHFAWALNGRAVQDVWLSPSREEQERRGVTPREWGTAVRFYDPASDSWRISWSGPYRARQIMLVARASGDQIVLEGDEGGTRVRWTFSEIGADSFRWTATVLGEGGSWRTIQEMRVRRRSRANSTPD